jgi:hypothetical protein
VSLIRKEGQLGVGILKPKPEPEPNPNRPNYRSIRVRVRVRVRFLYVLYFEVWVRVRFLTFKTRIDRITQNIKKLLIYDDIII